MKIWFAVFIIILGIVLVREIPITVLYSYVGNRPDEVQQGLDTWLKAGYKFVRSNSTNSLIITHNTPDEFVLSQNAAGENIGNIIRISTRYPRTDSDIIGIVSHEAGHFLGLSHNTEINSVMNPDLPLTKRPSYMDIRRVKWNKINFLKYIF
jgi:hypothetical protein